MGGQIRGLFQPLIKRRRLSGSATRPGQVSGRWSGRLRKVFNILCQYIYDMNGRIRRYALGMTLSTFIFFAVMTGGYCQNDPGEPNDVIGDATGLGVGAAAGGFISPAGDVDFYKFWIDNPGKLEVSLDGAPDEMRARIDFYGKNFNWITRVDASNPGDLVDLKQDLVNPGWYYIGILDLAGKSHDSGYNFALSFEPVVDDEEPNGEIGDAAEINFGEIVDGYIFAGGDVDFYKFYINSSGILDVILEGVPDDMKTRIDFYGKNFNWITRVDASNPGDLVTLHLDIGSPGWYYIGIVDLAGKSHNITYTFRPEFEPVVDGREPDGEIGDATEISFGDLVEGYVFPAADGDFYKFNVPSPGVLEVALTDSPDDMRTRIDLYGKNYNWITRVDASNPGDLVTLKLDLADPGWYRIGIVDLAGISHNALYAFTPIFEPVVDPSEPNSEIGDATEIGLGQAAGGIIFPAGDGDFYKLYVASTGKLVVTLTDTPADMKARIDLYGKNYNWITRVDASNPGDLATLEFEVADPGWYYLGVVDLEGKSHNKGYSFVATGPGAGAATGAAVGASSGAASGPGVGPSIGASDIGAATDGAAGAVGTTTGVAEGVSSSTSASYQGATLNHSGFDFSAGAQGEYPTFDGEIITWQPGAAAHPDYPRDSGYLWWRNTHLDDVNFSNQVKDMGAVDLASVREAPSEWDRSPSIPPLMVGHTIVARCYDGYVKFQVISVDPATESANVRYSYSADAVFDDAAV